MVSKVQRWGNSQGVRIPKHILEAAAIAVGDDLEVIAHEGQIVLKKVSKRKFDLAEMVSGTPCDYHVSEESFGKPAGREEW